MATVFINEFHYDNSGADTNEFIEIAGAAGTDLTGWSIVLYNGNNGTVYNTENLSGTIPDQSNGFGTVAVDISGIQNGSPDGIALVDNNNNVVQFLSYEGSFIAVGGPADGITSTDIGVSQPGSTPVDSSLQLQGEGSEDSDFNWVAVDGSNTKGSINASQTFSDGDSEEDTTAPELNDSNPLTPEDDTTDGLVDANLTIKFNENVQKGTGNIVIKKADDDSEVETFDIATSTAVTVNGDSVTINPTNNLEPSTEFYVEVDTGAIQDTAGNSFVGISGNETWNFTTGTEDSITPIYTIQGTAHTSPLLNQSVTTTGIVTAVDSNGFYLQDAMGDNQNATSDAIFVFTNSAPTVTVGDDVEVSGTVSEFTPGGTDTRNLSTTQISSPTVTVKSSSNPLPTATIIGTGGRVPPTENIDDDAFTSFDPDTDGIDFFESLEGMLVTAKDAVAVSPTSRFGEIFTVVDSGENATGISERGTLNISPDDFNPEKVQIDEDSDILPGFDFPNVDVGAKLGDVTGVVGYGFGNFEIYPTQEFTVTPSTLQPETTTIEGGADKLTVASYNVLNLDPNDSDGDEDVANGRFDAIASQIVNNLKTPDIIGLQEIQDNDGSDDAGVTAASDTLQQLADAIKTAGGPTYSFIDNTFIGDKTSGGQPGGNIRTAFLYNPERVGLVENSVESIQDSDQQTNEDNPFNGSRLPIVAKFTFNGKEVTVVNNHFSSKGGSAPILGLEQPFETRQEEVTVNGSLDERQAQANAVKDYVDGILADNADANVVVLGDLNEFEFVSPVETLDESLTNLTNTVAEDERYSFNFQGNSQSLDHILVSDNLANKAEFDIVQVNSEFAETTQRASDHDPLIASLSFPQENMDKINLSQIGTYISEDGAEIVAYDPTNKRLFVTTGDTVEIINISDPANPEKFGEIDVTSIDGVTYGGANSVAVNNGIVAVAVEADTAQDSGIVAFYNTDGTFIKSVTVGALPDMLTFTPDGTKVIVANEGEPNDDYDVDPEGSISIIDISGGVENLTNTNVTSAGFTGFNDQQQTLIDAGVRIFGPNATVAQDLEPEYVAVSADSSTAFVTLQENNAVAVLDIATATVEAIKPLGFKDYNAEGNGIDASNRDDGINIQNWPVLGMYQPDSIDSFKVGGQTYYITANEGDARIRPDGDIEDADGNVITEEGDIFNEEARIGDDEIVLDPTAFPNAEELKQDENLGRLKITNTLGDTDGDGDFDELYSYGGRSFSIWDDQGNLVFDSGDAIAQITASQTPEFFNANDGDTEEFDERSDDKGAEPESVTVGMVDGKPYGFIGLERAGGGVLVYDLSDPTAPVFNQYIRTEGDIAPEGLKFIAATDSPSPNEKPMLAVANEESKTTTLYEIATSDFTLQLLHATDQEGGIPALEDAPNFSAVLNALKNEDADSDGNADYENTLLLSSGDAYIPGLFLDASADPSLAPLLGEEGRGRSDIIIQNELGFQAIALGNHEFDLGTEFVASVIAPDGDYPGANFPYLSSNLDVSTDENLAPLVAADGQEASTIAGKIAKSAIVTVNGEKIGVVGATTPTLASISSPGDVTISPENPEDIAALAAEIQASVDALLADNPDLNKVVLISHMQQIAIEEQLAGLLKNVDIIMAGGSNTLLSDSTDRLRDGDSSGGAYPIVKTDADGKPVAVINTDGNYKYVGRLVVDFDANGNIIPGSVNPDVSGAYATDDAGVAAVNGTPDPEIVAITDALREVITDLESNFFGVTDTFLNGTRGSVRTEETNLGNLTADANLAAAKAVDDSVVISIKNGGGIRDNIGRVVTPPGATEPEFLPPEANELAGKPEGGISEVDIKNALRFNNGLTLLTATAEELLAIIEHGVSASEDGATPGRFPQVSGLKFSFDDDLPAGDRVQSLAVVDEDGEIIDVIAKDGELQGDAGRTFRLVTLGFLAGGGDDYPFPQGESANRVDLNQDEEAERTGEATFAEDGSEQDALAEYLQANFSEENPFSEEDVAPELDMRIQNLDFREDTVLEGLEGLVEEIETTTLADGTTVESIDLTGLTGQATINYTISREANFDNEVYFYEVDNINGTVDGIAVGEEGYMEAALGNVISPVFSISDDNTETADAQFDAGSVVVPLIIADGTFDEAFSGDADIYFSYLGANTDNGSFDHIKLLDNNTLGFEDLPNGGDEDFNDIQITINNITQQVTV
ncbi:alkaline phosphatase [Calothrix parasitica NIES-267]|uniref:Alkaline phosphatase n=1 Tax=Calothrix parasitica NIES-267 TaxID=1973488 RepID=A0A1Z4LHF6_9CYAN|nr:alkaline phosphatase [Calothrix parasitica NIES-267]